MEFASFCAEFAAIAHRRINFRDSVFLLYHSRASRNQALSALLAGIFMQNALSLRDKFLQKGAGGLGNDNRQGISLGFLLQQFFQSLNIKRINLVDIFNAHCLTQIIDIDCIGKFALQRFACCSMILVTGHSRSRVVQDNHCTSRCIPCSSEN